MVRPRLSSILHAILILATASAVLSESYAFDKPVQYVQSPALLPVSKQISPEVLRCKSTNPIVRGICDVALGKVNSELEAAGIAIRKDGVLFTYDDPKHVSIPTGHSCSVTAKVRHKHATAHFSSSSTLRLTGNSISDKLALRLKLPVRVSARVDVRQRFGARFFGKCKRYARDTFSLKAKADTRADVVVGLSLNPSFRKLSNGNFELTLMPVIAALFELDDLDLKFRVSKVSPITPIWTFIVGFKSTLLKSITGLFKGDSLKSIFKDIKRSLLYDFGAPVVLGIGALPRPLETLVFDALSNIAERKIERKAKGVGESLEDKLNDELRRALKLGPDGKRVIVIKGNFLDLLRSSPNTKDLFVVPPRTVTPRRPRGIGRGFRPRPPIKGGRRVYHRGRYQEP
ncbi:hypothetical protein BWQ96_05881 [Gracilariopsis chorda]|uniref:Uncharacterized protein n=1 Tax=Gracilariopsis chorda TaxID=448386 RepID=A0A2V3IQH3_9FLOR|nr:hypothetical protein BWQ96_05881 [Gracilariopsis chorda]|eukprot:PXF44361.1 hypothetical protein BWQ96_05881 [Gracilariopsis chorda]